MRNTGICLLHAGSTNFGSTR